jgi:hypothetical protein
MRLQRQVGNQAVAAMLAQRAGEEDEMQMSRDPAAAIQRDDGDDEMQMARAGGPEVGVEGGRLSEATSARIQAARGAGDNLDASIQADMESSFDTSFSDVRVHTGSESTELNHQLGAVAFTAGSDIFMRDGAYQPGSDDGRQLIAHELTHVVQQRDMPVSGSGPMHVGPAGDHYEQAAEASAAKAASPPAQRHSEHEH